MPKASKSRSRTGRLCNKRTGEGDWKRPGKNYMTDGLGATVKKFLLLTFYGLHKRPA